MPVSARSRSRTGGTRARGRGTSALGSVSSTGKLTCWRGKPSRKLRYARKAPDYGDMSAGDGGELGAGDGVAVTAGTGVTTTGLGADGDCTTGDTDGETDTRGTIDRDGTGTGTRPA